MRVVPERGAFEPVPVHSQGSPRGSVVYKAHVWDFPGGPVVKTPHFQGRDSIPGWGARSHMPSGMANKACSCPVVSVPVLGVFLETEHLERLQRRLLGSPQPSGLSVALDVLPPPVVPRPCRCRRTSWRNWSWAQWKMPRGQDLTAWRQEYSHGGFGT